MQTYLVAALIQHWLWDEHLRCYLVTLGGLLNLSESGEE